MNGIFHAARLSATGAGRHLAGLIARGSLSETRWTYFLILLVAFLAHGLCLRAEFFMDDSLHIVDNLAVQYGDWWEVPFRQLSYIFFCGLYAIVGPSSLAFHAWTLTLHLTITATVFGVGRRILRDAFHPDLSAQADLAALFGGLIFACHPFLSEGVNYAQNAALQLVTLFSLLAIWAAWSFVRLAKWSALVLLASFIVLASVSKEVGLIYAGLSAFVVLAAYAELGKCAQALKEGRRSSLMLVLALSGAILAGWQVLICWKNLLVATFENPAWLSHFFTQGRLFWDYVGAFFWPVGLCADHHQPFSGTWHDAEALIKTAAVLLLTVGVVVGAIFRRTRLACILALLALIPLLMRFVHVNKELFVEYRAYPALPWAALLAGWGLARLHGWKAWPVRGAMVVVVIACVITSARRSMMWGDRFSFAQDIVHRYPLHLRARTQLQKYDLEEGRWLSVMRRAKECRAAMAQIEEFNKRAPAGRFYELSMAYRCVMCSEHFYALALAETKGSAAALAHLTGIIEGLKNFNPNFLDPARSDFEIGRQLVEARDILVRYGSAYDRLRSAPGDPAALAEIARLRDIDHLESGRLP